MKKLTSIFPLALSFCLFLAVQARAVVFSSSSNISPLNTSYDGQDIVISNCTVTVDGAHGFASVTVTANGVLAHSFSPNGTLTIPINVTNEQQTLSGTTAVQLLSSNIIPPVIVTDLGQTVVYTNGFDYTETDLAGGVVQIARIAGSSIPDGATVLVDYTWQYVVAEGLNFTVTNGVTVAPGSSINVNAIGYAGGLGQGHGRSSSVSFFDGSGGGDGGNGGMSASNALGGICYDSLYQPAAMGSGGGTSYAGGGGNGGGLVQIVAGGNVEIDGTVSANGGSAVNSRAGGGSGGGIWISAASVGGAGMMTANGGAGAPGYGGGGGGGRIAIVCGANNFSGTTTAYGGSGANYGGAGTFFTQLTGQTGMLLLNNGGNTGTNSTVSLPTMADVVVSGNAGLIPSGAFFPRNVTIGVNSLITAAGSFDLILTMSNLTVQAGGQFSLNGLGTGNYGGGGGTYSSGPYSYGGGGGHGGYGGAGAITASGGTAYDYPQFPAMLGSVGGGGNVTSFGGAGGGAAQLNVSGALEIDGALTANGNNGSGIAGGGGSGGSLNLQVASIAGAGVITANGGAGANSLGGGGGGGRIAIVAGANTFAGTINCFGGAGANRGGAGTIYLQTAGGTPEVLLDNGGVAGGPATPVATLSGENLVIQNGASGMGATSVTTLNSLLVASNSFLTLYGGPSSGGFTITSNATIQAGGGLIADSQGYSANQGSGAGGLSTGLPSYPGGGGGYGGMGGSSLTNLAPGGRAGYENIIAPAYPGSGGGGYVSFSFGGSGGGNVQMTVNGTLQLNGIISANGGNGSGGGGGGGSGGTVYLTGGTITGSGSISANGGAGVPSVGGGGGGGCVALVFNTNTFGGPIAASGGPGAFYGGAGTIYFKTNTAANAQLTVDNAGHSGAGTVIQSLFPGNLTVRNGAIVDTGSGLSFVNVLIATNAQVVVTNNSTFSFQANNIVVQAGCSITANSAGNQANSGPDPGRFFSTPPYYPGGGGGNGGYGGNGATNLAYGGLAAFGTQNTPNTPGSGGGGQSPYSIGGSGGGVIQLTVSGLLQLNGTLSANAGNGLGTGGGGGSGGSLQLNVGSLTGSGVISANGGSGANSQGGGGGGGMISISFNSSISQITNSFNGAITAYGGGGASFGGAGTVFLRTNVNNQSLMIVDNGGNVGTNTGIAYSSSVNGLILRNGAIGCFAFSGQSFSTLLITSNAWLVPGTRTGGSVGLSCSGNVNIQAGGGIIADSYGSTQNQGTGHGNALSQSPYFPGSGGGHGGYGAFGISNLIAGGVAYDSTTLPTQLGSGGGGYNSFSIGGSGGGGVSLNVQSPFVTTVNGVISANGQNGSGSGGGGGSGGSVTITTRTLVGTGSITANGGSGMSNVGGGGGGGRIALIMNQNPFIKTNFSGLTVTAYGGGGASYGGAGTVYYLTNLLSSTPTVVLDNNGHVGTNTSFNFNNYDVLVQNGAIGLLPSSGQWGVHSLTILSNSAMTALSTTANINLQPSSLTIAQGGAMTLDGDGSGAQAGPGSGASSGGINGGGGHGGYGGGNPGGNGGAYDSIVSPAIAGSGGANYQSITGGTGGGTLTISSGTITINGRLSANGTSGGINAGGGSGGSLQLSVGSLTGSGVISANGGSAIGMGGGGGGGRIAMVCSANTFTGQSSAYGGGGNYPGGAGTVYTASGGSKALLVNNGGAAGTNTPLAASFTFPTSPFDLDVSGAAAVAALSSLPVLSNLNLSAATSLTMPVTQSNLFIGVLNNANIGGNLNVDQAGYPLTSGPGAGSSLNNDGSGGGYGGTGGASSSAASGGITYGSASEPMDFGSGGGHGAATANGGSGGGGALRLGVLGTLNVTGNLSANGSAGAQDNSGGGSGGSIWITAGALSGNGNISANGGNGVLSGGGGGGGGRIAIYTPTNNFSGTTNVNGGSGDVSGQAGTIFLGNAFTDFEIISQSPTGLVMNTVSTVTLGFNDMVSATSLSASDFTLITPEGTLPSSSLTVTASGPFTVQVGFPIQNLVGNYTIEATTISNMLGVPLAVPYSGTFSISLPTISGTVTNINGAPVAGVMVQPNGGLTGMMTDVNGNYSIGVPNGWNGTMTPALGTNMFVPGSLSYTGITGSLTNQNYLMVQTVAPEITSSAGGNNFTMSWNGIAGVTYQVLWSPDLVNWQPVGDAMLGTNGPMQVAQSTTNAAAYFTIQATH